ncbi:hypothetical protein ASG58_11180 [Rhizobium sp. Leaf383]|nr:hypothetical protein ASG58_11180 [Rhizobium sp. Leaf383]
MKLFSVMTGFLIFACGPAAAVERLNLATMSCEMAISLTGRDGGAVLRKRSERIAGLTLYKRYVRHSGQCLIGEVARPVKVQASDRICVLRTCQLHSNIWKR